MRDLDPRLQRIASRAWLRLPEQDRAILLDVKQCQIKQCDRAELPDRYADAGADGLIRLRTDLPDGEAGAAIVAHECAHILHGHPALVAQRPHLAGAVEAVADEQTAQWGFAAGLAQLGH
jgi:hypothetical protein